MKILLVAINAKYIHSNPAVYLLRASLGALREQAEIREYSINELPETILADIYRAKPELLALSCYIWNRRITEQLLPELPKILPGVPLWLGGPEASMNAPELLLRFPGITGILLGEGEVSFQELCEAYAGGLRTPLSEIPGLCFLQNRQPVYTPPREPTPADDLPFFYREWAGDPALGPFRNRILYYESSRGCPFRCSYCLSSLEKDLRFRSQEKVFSELQFFLDRRVPQVKFIDRTFNCDPVRAEAIWRYLKEHDNGITNFHFEIAADLFTESQLRLLSTLRPGQVQLEIGVQSTNPETLREVRRTASLEKIMAAVRQIRSFGNIRQHLDLIAGLPGEDLSRFRESFNAIYALGPEELQLGFLKVLQGSLMAEKAKEYGLLYRETAPYEVLSTRWLSYGDLLELKSVEEMLEIYHNSGQFTRTLPVLLPLFGGPYVFFLALARFTARKGYSVNTPARSRRYEILLEMAVEKAPALETLFRELLTFDLYLRENMKSRPSFARDLEPFKEDIRRRERKKGEHIEPFFYPVFRPLTEKDMTAATASPCFVCFDYENRDALLGNARTECL